MGGAGIHIEMTACVCVCVYSRSSPPCSFVNTSVLVFPQISLQRAPDPIVQHQPQSWRVSAQGDAPGALHPPVPGRLERVHQCLQQQGGAGPGPADSVRPRAERAVRGRPPRPNRLPQVQGTGLALLVAGCTAGHSGRAVLFTGFSFGALGEMLTGSRL